MKDRIQVTVEQETKKALLVSAEGKKGWIQRRWARDDMTVKRETFEKSAADFEANAEIREFTNNWKNEYHPFPSDLVVRETEKAVALEATVVCEHTDQWHTRLAWFPKSQIKENTIPGWLILKKIDELRDDETAYAGKSGLTVLIDGLA